MTTPPNENKVVFLATVQENGKPIVFLGISKEAWEHMKDGKTHTFDLTKVGIPLQLVLFGGPDKSTITSDLKESAKAWGIEVYDQTDKDFSIPDKKLH